MQTNLMGSVNRVSINFIVTRILSKSGNRVVLVNRDTQHSPSRHFFSSPVQAAKEVTKSSPKKNSLLIDDAVVFTQSPAYKDWKAAYLIELPDHRPKIQRPVALASLVIFMVYFFILREENDLDELIYQPLTKTVPEIELSLLEAALEAHITQNLPTLEIEKKIAEVKSRAQFKQMVDEKQQAKDTTSK